MSVTTKTILQPSTAASPDDVVFVASDRPGFVHLAWSEQTDDGKQELVRKVEAGEIVERLVTVLGSQSVVSHQATLLAGLNSLPAEDAKKLGFGGPLCPTELGYLRIIDPMQASAHELVGLIGQTMSVAALKCLRSLRPDLSDACTSRAVDISARMNSAPEGYGDHLTGEADVLARAKAKLAEATAAYERLERAAE